MRIDSTGLIVTTEGYRSPVNFDCLHSFGKQLNQGHKCGVDKIKIVIGKWHLTLWSFDHHLEREPLRIRL